MPRKSSKVRIESALAEVERFLIINQERIDSLRFADHRKAIMESVESLKATIRSGDLGPCTQAHAAQIGRDLKWYLSDYFQDAVEENGWIRHI